LENSPLKLLILGHVWPQPNASAAGEHMLHLIHLFRDMGYQLHFATAAQMPEHYNELDGLDIQCTSVEINDNDFDFFIDDLQPNVVLFDRFMVEEQFSWRIKKILPQALLVLDTEDIHFLRKQREARVKGRQQEALSDIAKRELASIYRCDMSLVISQAEIELLLNKYQVPKQQLFYLPLLSEKLDIKNTPSFKEREDLIFVGNFLHEPNWQAVQVLKKEIWPLVRKQKPNLKIHIYGAYASQKHLQLNNEKEGFLVHGFVQDIETAIKNARLLVAPLYFGAGQKGKLLKAMQCGTPTITTKIGAEAMQFDKQWPGMIANDYKDFASAIIMLYANAGVWQQKQLAIEPLVNSHFQYEVYLKKLEKALKILENNLEHQRDKNITGQILWHHSMRSTEFMSRWIMEKNTVK